MKRTREEVMKKIQENAERIRAFGVRRIGLFGSCARNEIAESSDLDFVVDLERKTFDAYMDVKEFLEDLFGCKVDLVMTESIKPALRDIILGEAVYAQGI